MNKWTDRAAELLEAQGLLFKGIRPKRGETARKPIRRAGGKKIKLPSGTRATDLKRWAENMFTTWKVSWDRDRDDKLWMYIKPTPRTGDQTLKIHIDTKNLQKSAQELYDAALYGAKRTPQSKLEKEAWEAVARLTYNRDRPLVLQQEGWKVVPAARVFKPGMELPDLATPPGISPGQMQELLWLGAAFVPPKGYKKQAVKIAPAVYHSMQAAMDSAEKASTIKDLDDAWRHIAWVRDDAAKELVRETGHQQGARLPAPMIELNDLQAQGEAIVGRKVREILGELVVPLRKYVKAYIRSGDLNRRFNSRSRVLFTNAELAQIAKMPTKKNTPIVRKLVKLGVLQKEGKAYALAADTYMLSEVLK